MAWAILVANYHKSHKKRLEILIMIEAYIQLKVLKKNIPNISFDCKRQWDIELVDCSEKRLSFLSLLNSNKIKIF